MSKWFKRGFDNTQKQIEQNQADRDSSNVSRFWIKAQGQPRTIIFLDDWSLKYEGTEIVPFSFHEHRIELNGDFRNKVHTPCTRQMGECWLCDNHQYRKQFIGACSILDITAYTNKDGHTMITPRKKVWAGVSDAILLLQSKRERRLDKKEDLQGSIYTVARHDKKQPIVGSDYEFERHVDDIPAYLIEHLKCRTEDVEKLDLKPFGLSAEETLKYYEELFNPLTTKELENLFSNNDCQDQLNSWAKKNAPSSTAPSSPSATDSVQY